MAPIDIPLRRTLFLLLLLAAAVGAALSWWRDESTTATPAAPPQWPPLPERPSEPERPSGPAAPSSQAWVPPLGDGSVPASHPIKVKASSGIYHEPGGRFYDRTRPDRCYQTSAGAEADGYRRSKT